MKRLCSSLASCKKEEEVKAEFCKFFKMKIFALRGIDHWKIETWDVGYYQIRNAMKDLRASPLLGHPLSGHPLAGGYASPREEDSLRASHDALRAKLLPQIYSLGFLNPDVEYFK